MLHSRFLLIFVKLVLIGTIFILEIQGQGVTDYYWREYLGEIPSDALPGGYDRAGKRTYIGQVYAGNKGLLPATITQGSRSALSGHGGRSFTSDTFVKILCVNNPDRYVWIPTRNEDHHLLIGYHLVIGGTEAGYVLNIGRVYHEMETIVGKIFAHHTPYRGLSIPYKDRESVYQSYEILAYKMDGNDETNVA